MKEIPLTQGKVAIVDDDDFAPLALHKWYCQVRSRSLYASRHVGGRCLQMQNVLLPPVSGLVVDHINGDGLDNRRANLRYATAGQNMANRRKSLTARTSKFKGVHWHTLAGKWRASIRFMGKMKHLGTFLREEDAARAYDRVAASQWGEYAKLNFPPDASLIT